MSAPRNRKHIFVTGPPTAEAYKPHGRKIDVAKPEPPASRARHGKALERALTAASVEAGERRREAGIEVHGVVPGLYIQFESPPGVPLRVASLEDIRQGIEVVAVSHTKTDEQEPRHVERATVFVPEGKVKHFLDRFARYANTSPKKKGERRYEDMLDRIATLRLATLRGLWTDTTEAYPDEGETIWWEVWLRRDDGEELTRLMEFAGARHIEVAQRRLQFADRIVTLVRATSAQLAASIDVLNDVAEVRKAKEVASVFVDMAPEEQGDWATELRDRITPPSADAPAVCVLDTGVTQGHLLLAPALAQEDVHAVDPTWGGHDDGGGPTMRGHGTQMAGLALYGDLTSVLASTHPLVLRHRLESVKILPPHGHAPNPPELYGAVTAEAASRVEIQAPARRRIFSMAVAATDERDRGQPTSWSAAVDALAAGRSFDPTTRGLDYLDDGDDAARRLFVLCAGNVHKNSLSIEHLDRSDTDAIHDPGQAWNALGGVVGADADASGRRQRQAGAGKARPALRLRCAEPRPRTPQCERCADPRCPEQHPPVCERQDARASLLRAAVAPRCPLGPGCDAGAPAHHAFVLHRTQPRPARLEEAPSVRLARPALRREGANGVTRRVPQAPQEEGAR